MSITDTPLWGRGLQSWSSRTIAYLLPSEWLMNIYIYHSLSLQKKNSKVKTSTIYLYSILVYSCKGAEFQFLTMVLKCHVDLHTTVTLPSLAVKRLSPLASITEYLQTVSNPVAAGVGRRMMVRGGKVSQDIQPPSLIVPITCCPPSLVVPITCCPPSLVTSTVHHHCSPAYPHLLHSPHVQ